MFSVIASMNDEIMNEFVGWCRFIVFDGDPSVLHDAK